MSSAGHIEVDLFSKEVDGPDHPEARSFRSLLEEVARQYDSRLVFFEVQEGTVTFALDSDELTAEILKVLQRRE